MHVILPGGLPLAAVSTFTMFLVMTLENYPIVDCPYDKTFYSENPAVYEDFDNKQLDNLLEEYKVGVESIQKWKKFKHGDSSETESSAETVGNFGNETADLGFVDHFFGPISSPSRDSRLIPIYRDRRSLKWWYIFKVPLQGLDEILRHGSITKDIYTWIRKMMKIVPRELRMRLNRVSSVPVLRLLIETIEFHGCSLLLQSLITMIHFRFVWPRVCIVLKWAKKRWKGLQRHVWDLYQCEDDLKEMFRLTNAGTMSAVQKRGGYFAFYEWDGSYAVASVRAERNYFMTVRTGGIVVTMTDLLVISCIDDIETDYSESNENDVSYIQEITQEMNLTVNDFVCVLNCTMQCPLPRQIENAFFHDFMLFCKLGSISFYCLRMHLWKGLVSYGFKSSNEESDEQDDEMDDNGEFVMSVTAPILSCGDSTATAALITSGTCESETPVPEPMPGTTTECENSSPTSETQNWKLLFSEQPPSELPATKRGGDFQGHLEKPIDSSDKKSPVRSKSLTSIPSPHFNLQKGQSKRLPRIWRNVTSSPLPALKEVKSPTQSETPKCDAFPEGKLIKRPFQVPESSPKTLKGTKIPRKAAQTTPQKNSQTSAINEQFQMDFSPASSNLLYKKSPLANPKLSSRSSSLLIPKTKDELKRGSSSLFGERTSIALQRSLEKASALFESKDDTKESARKEKGPKQDQVDTNTDTDASALYGRPVLSHLIIKKFPSYFDANTRMYKTQESENIFGRNPALSRPDAFRRSPSLFDINTRRLPGPEEIRSFSSPLKGSFSSPRLIPAGHQFDWGPTPKTNQQQYSAGDVKLRKDLDKFPAFRPPDKNHISRKPAHHARNRSISMSTLKKPDVTRPRFR